MCLKLNEAIEADALGLDAFRHLVQQAHYAEALDAYRAYFFAKLRNPEKYGAHWQNLTGYQLKAGKQWVLKQVDSEIIELAMQGIYTVDSLQGKVGPPGQMAWVPYTLELPEGATCGRTGNDHPFWRTDQGSAVRKEIEFFRALNKFPLDFMPLPTRLLESYVLTGNREHLGRCCEILDDWTLKLANWGIMGIGNAFHFATLFQEFKSMTYARRELWRLWNINFTHFFALDGAAWEACDTGHSRIAVPRARECMPYCLLPDVAGPLEREAFDDLLRDRMRYVVVQMTPRARQHPRFDPDYLSHPTYEWLEPKWTTFDTVSAMKELLWDRDCELRNRLQTVMKNMGRIEDADAIRYTGHLDVPADGVYVFHAPEHLFDVTMDAGFDLRVWVDGDEWFPSTRIHAQNTWSVALRKGLHDFKVAFVDFRYKKFKSEYWLPWQEEEVWQGIPTLRISGPGMVIQPLPQSWLKRRIRTRAQTNSNVPSNDRL